jgi:hypothetical protein
MDVKRRWKSLSHKVEHLRLEVEDRDDAIKNFEKEFLEELSKLDTEEIPGTESKPVIPEPIVVNNINEDLSEELPSPDVATGPEEMKKLWKAIAALSHPDKTKNDSEKTELYKRAAAAWKSKSYDELYRIALELGIEPPDASEESIAVLNGITHDLEKKLKESETTVLWMWGTTSPEKRKGIIDIWLASRGKKRKQPV